LRVTKLELARRRSSRVKKEKVVGILSQSGRDARAPRLRRTGILARD
jgi:hypothetical protein